MLEHLDGERIHLREERPQLSGFCAGQTMHLALRNQILKPTFPIDWHLKSRADRVEDGVDPPDSDAVCERCALLRHASNS